MIKSLAIILIFVEAGNLLQRVMHVPLPPNVLGLMLLYGALRTGLVKADGVKPAGDFLLRHMTLFFAPSVVGAGYLLGDLIDQWPRVLFSIVVSTWAGLICTGLLLQRLLNDSTSEEVPEQEQTCQ